MSKLLPVILSTQRKIDTAHPGSLVTTRTLCSADNTYVTRDDLPLEWLQYMKQALNNYYVARQTMDDMPDTAQYPMLTAVTIEGEPMPNRTTKMLQELSKERNELLSRQGIELPIKQKVWLSCVFHMKKDKDEFNLTDLCAGIAHDLVQLKILHKSRVPNVFCLDGSKIVYTESEPKSIVYIRATKTS